MTFVINCLSICPVFLTNNSENCYSPDTKNDLNFDMPIFYLGGKFYENYAL